jgi:hypothetical protein
VRAFSLELADDDQRQHDLMLVKTPQGQRIGKQDARVEYVRSTVGGKGWGRGTGCS